ncbi:ABC transporter ATP-binding protein [Kineococcus sp. GCM10028916]|uniref:ABC transporter ATP-binding protein n=1 Tax=unclassified Kineococcus TaxID=2621656 RepID=UPI002E1A5892
MITFEAVRKQFPDGTVAVEQLDLELPTGQITVFVGPSGCGKTTSLRMINRMIEPTGGRITIDGDDVRSKDPAALRRGIGYVIQHAGLFPHKTVLDNVMTVPKLVGRGKQRQVALELLERVGLPTAFADRYPAQLSGGQQQRVGVARALAADPPVMLMDEPFSAVDPIVRGQLQEEFLRLQGELGKTIAIVTHDIDEAITLGDRIAVFREGGHLAQVGSPRDLLTKPADDFVRHFVGRDRGYRGLSFEGLQDLPVRPVTDETFTTLALDEAGRPVGIDGFRAGDSLRTVIDLTLTSPHGIAVQVDDEGRATGFVHHHDVVDLLEKRR